jgi:hypothetical protein
MTPITSRRSEQGAHRRADLLHADGLAALEPLVRLGIGGQDATFSLTDMPTIWRDHCAAVEVWRLATCNANPQLKRAFSSRRRSPDRRQELR